YLGGADDQSAADVTLFRYGGPAFAGVWHGWLTVDVEQPTGLSVAAQLEKARELADAGWHPVALGVVDAKLTASVWHRPSDAVSPAALRRGHAAAALLALGEPGAAWPALRFPADGDPTARSYLIQRLAGIGVDPLALV